MLYSDKKEVDSISGLIFATFFLDLAQQLVAHLLRVAQQHRRVRLVEDRVVNGRVTDTERALHDDDLINDEKKSTSIN